jgi:heme exporter protein A
MNAFLQIDKLTCRRNEKDLFTDISFELDEGEMLLIEGHNGSGKSSLLRILTGLSTPYSGEIRWMGNNIQTIRDDYSNALHYIGHTNGIKSGLTVLENLQLTQHLSGTTFTTTVNVLESLQMKSHQHSFAKNLSAGQKRRLALARLLLIQKKIWILDEPLTALDIHTQTFFISSLEHHLQQGGLAIISSHQPLMFQNVLVKSLRLSSC